MNSEHPAVLGRDGNVLFARFGTTAPTSEPRQAPGPQCLSCAHWYAGDGTAGEGACLADCGLRSTPADSICGDWCPVQLRSILQLL